MLSTRLLRLAVALSLLPAAVVSQTSYSTPNFAVQLDSNSQTLYSLKPKSGANTAFNYVPDVISQRQANGNYHVGDITFRVRKVGSTAWISGDSAASRKAVTALSVSGTTLAAADLTPTLPSGSLLNIKRRWAVNNNTFELLFDVTNSQTTAVEIGSLGAPLEFNNIFTGRTAADTNEKCSFTDPYIGNDAGYVQVTPLLGTLPALVVTPSKKSPLEGWRFLSEPAGSFGYQSQTFEGLYEWQFHTLAWSQNEWKAVTPWNAPTSATLQPGETRTYGLQFQLASSIKNIETTVRAAGHPLAQGIPGYIIGQDVTAKLFLSYSSAVSTISVSPAGALSWTAANDGLSTGWVGYTITGSSWGRSRLSITYADGTVQTVHYYVTKASTEAISNLGNFLTTSQWFTDTSDPFQRAPSIISYDREVNAIVKNDPRVWISGLSDEGGAGSWMAGAYKQFAQPSAAEVTKLEQFIDITLDGVLQNSDGSVKKSVFFYEPATVPGYTYPGNNWGNWWSWNKANSYAIDRAYDYPHVAAAYWSLYRVARNYPSLVKTHTWQWYLDKAVLTITAMTNGRVGYTDVGLMGETVFGLILSDLKREGRTSDATSVEAKMKARYNVWAGQKYPFGSEMAWDSTGEEGVYYWAKYFSNPTLATNTVNAILAYKPTVPHWGYNGNSRRYWDNIYGGKLQRIERQIHHYGSGLNALPLISAYQGAPTDYYLLRAAYGGLSGALSNIDQSGFASASFHSFADTLKWDGYSGDYGPNFGGHVMGIGTYIIQHPDFGWQAFGGNVVATSPTVQVQPKDSLRRRIFIAPIAALLTLDAGAFSLVSYNPTTKAVEITVAASSGATNAAAAPQGRLVIEKTTSSSTILKPSTTLAVDAGAYVIPFTSGSAKVTLTL